MDLALGNLNDLKREVLPIGPRGDTQYDQVLQTIGKQVAEQFQRHCNRKFPRVEGATFEFPANRTFAVLDRFPLEAITAIEQRDTVADGWTPLIVNDVIQQRQDGAGLVEFGYLLGDYTSLVRITFTGGWWYDTDENYGTAQPAGSTAVPADVKGAWILQVQHVLERRDALRKGAIKDTKQEPVVQTVELLDQVKDILRGHIRYA